MPVSLIKTNNLSVVIGNNDFINNIPQSIQIQNANILVSSHNKFKGSIDVSDTELVKINDSVFTDTSLHAISIDGFCSDIVITNNMFRSINISETQENTIRLGESSVIDLIQVNNNTSTKGALISNKPNYFLYLTTGGSITQSQIRDNAISASSCTTGVTNITESLNTFYGGVKIIGDLEVTGYITLGHDPTSDMHATTKRYVDNHDATYIHTQEEADTTWIINHNLNKKPSVFIEDPTGDDIYGEIAYPSMNMITISFTSAETGTAYLN